MKKKDEIGNRYGKLVVLNEVPRRVRGKTYWQCKCDCGNYKIVCSADLRSGFVKSCDKCHSTKKDETGNRYGKLAVLSEVRRHVRGNVCWQCKCDCGNYKIACGVDLRRGRIKSCGKCRDTQYGKSAVRSKKIDETGNRYGKLTVLKEVPFCVKGAVCWRCKCDCGNYKIASGVDLRSGAVKSCGKCHRILKKDEKGNRYGKLVVLNEVRRRLKGAVCWRCKCDCGNYKIVSGINLRCGAVKSCGKCPRKKIG